MGKHLIWPKRNHQTKHLTINNWYNKLAESLHTLKRREKRKNQASVTWLPIPIGLIQSSTRFSIYSKETGKNIFTICLVIFIRKKQKQKEALQQQFPFLLHSWEENLALIFETQERDNLQYWKRAFFPVSRELQIAARQDKKQPQMKPLT